MKKLYKRIKIRIKSNLITKLAVVKKENKYLREKILENTINERKYIDKINNMKREIRSMKLNG